MLNWCYCRSNGLNIELFEHIVQRIPFCYHLFEASEDLLNTNLLCTLLTKKSEALVCTVPSFHRQQVVLMPLSSTLSVMTIQRWILSDVSAAFREPGQKHTLWSNIPGISVSFFKCILHFYQDILPMSNSPANCRQYFCASQ